MTNLNHPVRRRTRDAYLMLRPKPECIPARAHRAVCLGITEPATRRIKPTHLIQP